MEQNIIELGSLSTVCKEKKPLEAWQSAKRENQNRFFFSSNYSHFFEFQLLGSMGLKLQTVLYINIILNENLLQTSLLIYRITHFLKYTALAIVHSHTQLELHRPFFIVFFRIIFT